MRFILCLLLFQITSTGFTQENINYFDGDFDLALEEAKKTNKNIFFITKSESCTVFGVFKENITEDSETKKFLNSKFIVFEFDMDKASKKEAKRLKKYYNSWKGFPQLYFIDKNEKLISDISYSLDYSHKENLEVWKKYKQIESDWKKIKKEKRNNLTLESLKSFLFYRQIKYSSFDLMQMKNAIEKYFKGIDKKEYSNNENWILFEKYITYSSNPSLFNFVAQNKKDFQSKNNAEKISNYLTSNYNEILFWKSKEERKLLINEYPFNTITEAKEALKNYKETEPSFELSIPE